MASKWVSIHAPVWVRRVVPRLEQIAYRFQFTHPCGCDPSKAPKSCWSLVSIHAPVWVRLFYSWEVSLPLMFQFTHPCGCDRPASSVRFPGAGFNSRTRVGATHARRLYDIRPGVSIHAPVWVRQQFADSDCEEALFQFTHPCGCDLQSDTVPEENVSFNSRTRVGATFFTRPGEWEELVSIHAPVWVRPVPASCLSSCTLFQFTHPCGCDGLTNTV